jgi:hypothetical protein
MKITYKLIRVNPPDEGKRVLVFARLVFPRLVTSVEFLIRLYP